MSTCRGNLFVQGIERTECIGNSLIKINSNFSELDTAICESDNKIETVKSTYVKQISAGEGISVRTNGNVTEVSNAAISPIAAFGTCQIISTGIGSQSVITNYNINRVRRLGDAQGTNAVGYSRFEVVFANPLPSSNYTVIINSQTQEGTLWPVGVGNSQACVERHSNGTLFQYTTGFNVTSVKTVDTANNYLNFMVLQ